MAKKPSTKQAHAPAEIPVIARATLKALQSSARALPPDRVKKVDSSEAVLGARTPDIRAVTSELFSKVKAFPPDDALRLVRALLSLKTFETRQIAYEILGRHCAVRRSLTLRDLEEIGRGIDNWTAVDIFGGQVAGIAWREKQIDDRDIARWAHSDDRWWRRCALVCTIALNQGARGGKGDVARTLKICGMLVKDRDDTVVKALSWALRELIPHDTEAVEMFLKEHETELQSRVVREVRTKLDTGLKNPRKT